MNKKILCTLGPKSFHPHVIRRLSELGVSLFRINLSHTKIKDLSGLIKLIQSHTQVPICLDSEGAQIRTGDFLHGSCEFHENTTVLVSRKKVLGNGMVFNLTPEGIHEHFHVGDLITIDFNAVIAQVIRTSTEGAFIRILNGGKVGSNKAVTIDRQVPLEAITKKDTEAFKIGLGFGVKDFALSFANTADDVQQMRRIVGSSARIISKIECTNGLKNLTEIVKASDAILIDRGDLSREEPIERIPYWQKVIIKETKKYEKSVFVATNLLESMIVNAYPTRAEVNDVYNTLYDGADGLVLAAETAIGDHPVECVSMVRRLIHEYETHATLSHTESIKENSMNTLSLIIEPHGGKLINQYVTKLDDSIKTIKLALPQLLDCEQIAIGTYSPLVGFMGRNQIESVLKNNKLENGLIWTMPVTLQMNQEKADLIKVGNRYNIADEKGTIYFEMHVEAVFKMNLDSYCKNFFGTNSLDHPGVKVVQNGGDYFIEAKIYKIRTSAMDLSDYFMTPAQARTLFAKKGWTKVVGFHTRNVVHRAHEFIQKKALKDIAADGLFIHPVIGPKKWGDYLHEPILKSYQTLLDFGFYPEGKVVLSAFASYSRYAGPREAVFTALCRKNYGCSHFIIGRDHTGVANFYENIDLKDYFQNLGDLGVSPVFFSALGYNLESQEYEEMGQNKTILSISGTEARQKILNKEHLPDWYLRDEVQDSLKDILESGNNIFYE